jgi:cob(I)alamin adenosyltransferase
MVYLNRLSDYLYLLARYENLLAGVEETDWIPGEQTRKPGLSVDG